MGYFVNLVGCGASVHTVDDISQTTVSVAVLVSASDISASSFSSY